MAQRTPIYLTWLNYLGGFDYWFFTAKNDFQIDIIETGETQQNIFPDWPNSYGEFADTIDRTTYRRAKQQIVLRSQNLTKAQAQVLSYIKTSPVVQIITSRTDRRTVLVDNDSFVIYSETEKIYSLAFTLTFTDEIPSQTI